MHAPQDDLFENFYCLRWYSMGNYKMRHIWITAGPRAEQTWCGGGGRGGGGYLLGVYTVCFWP